MQDFVYGGAYRPISDEPTTSEVRGITPQKKLQNHPRCNRHQKSAAPPPPMWRIDESVE